ncbi:probable C-mannosyltransferase DPY19L4 isoform X3 [Electrophorus electricus]|uniref:probable C-mannosyltransferase DPY19L4 isoform X3 n=1 Tax=Electrophorus electricus TaxID=8005 RepID=UPI0015CFACAB|nr:probable C-mannosyltransferase DPY19L4 isoform X3 [Electrophorus electricus]
MAELRCRREKDDPASEGPLGRLYEVETTDEDDSTATRAGAEVGTADGAHADGEGPTAGDARKGGTDVEGASSPKEEEKVDHLSANGTGSAEGAHRCSKLAVLLQRVVKLFIGCLAAVTCGMIYAVYLSTYHERKFWFSSRQEMEREITFQGGSGLYYYYYKHMLFASSFEKGVYELTRDNRTVSGQTINAVEQLSLYPELLCSLLYKLSGSQDSIEPVYFYIGVVFGLQAVYVTALFVCSWVMSGTWVAGLLAVAWYIINRPDTTTVVYAIPLRDNWALPYFSCQVAALTSFLSNNISAATEMFCYLLMSVTTFTFIVMWEHGHYVLFVQGVVLLLLDCFDLIPARKTADIHKVYLSSLLLAYVLQYQRSALLSSPLLSLLVASLLARYLQNMKMGPLVARLMKLVLHLYLVFTTGITFNYLVKKILPVDQSDFILKFLEVKFGLNSTTEFIPNLLLCEEGFQSPGQDLFLRLTQASVLPFYVLVMLVCLFSTMQAIYRRLSGERLMGGVQMEQGRIGERPEVIYHVFHTLLFGALAMLFQGMKYLWTPYVCAFTAFGVCSPELWVTVFRWVRLKSVHPVVLALILSTAVPTIIAFSLWREFFPRVLSELTEVQEFYDPDTVELMNWIKSHAPLAAVFAASPALLGTVKVCTGWPVTSLPLYTDLSLLQRSESTYQVYAMRSAEEVYKLLTAQQSSFVIVEEELCNQMSSVRGCRIKDLLDYANGHVVYDKGETYTFAKYGRFCHEIKMNYSPYTNYFTRVFWNRSYHVYRVNSVISFQY